MNVSTDPGIIDDVATKPFHIEIIDHPMKPFGMRYWRYWWNSFQLPLNVTDYLERSSPQACSWLRDQEYLVDLRFYELIEVKSGFYNEDGYHSYAGNLSNLMFFLPKTR